MNPGTAPPGSRATTADAEPTNRAASSAEPTTAPENATERQSPLLEETSPDDAEQTLVRAESRSIRMADVALVGLFLLAACYTLYFTRPLLLPLLLAILLNFVFSPLVRTLHGYGIPRVVSAIVLLVSLLSILFFAVYRISEPASEFIASVPQRLPLAERRLHDVLRPMQEVARTAEQVERATGNGDAEANAVVLRGPGLLETSVGYARSFGAGALITLILLIFLLSMDQIFLHKLVRVLPTFHDKRIVVEIFREIESDISRYLSTVTLINLALGAAVTGTMYLLGVPNPFMWGAMAGLLNFIPYLGAGISFVVLLFVGIVTFDEPIWMFAPAATFLGLNILEAYFVTPLTLGNRLNLNPVAIFLSLAAWSFIWGVPGMLLAVPLLVMLKLCCDHFEHLRPVSEFLSAAETSHA